MDPLSLSAFITGILALAATIASHIHSFTCSKTNGVDIEFNNTTTPQVQTIEPTIK